MRRLPHARGGQVRGRVGPNLDIRVGEQNSSLRRTKALVVNAILEGRARGTARCRRLLYQGKEAEEVADFVAAVAGH